MSDPQEKIMVNHSEDADLARMLSIHSLHPVPSVVDNSQASSSAEYRKIGARACGAVFASDKDEAVTKFAKTTDDMIWNEHQMHIRIWDAFQLHPGLDIDLPKHHYFISKDDPNYPKDCPPLRAAAGPTCNLPANYIVNQRIPALPQSIRSKLIDTFCHAALQQSARADPANKDCLVRVYLGSQEERVSPRFFSLRNFKLHLNQMVDLQMDVLPLARLLAQSLAVMHWEAETNARDVEFVLGSSSPQSQQLMATRPASDAHSTGFWVLDFNQVRNISLDSEGVRMALDAIKANDPYFPRPLHGSVEAKSAWNAFAMEYHGVSTRILRRTLVQEDAENIRQSQSLDLPAMFLHGLIVMERERQARARSQFTIIHDT